MTRATSWDLVVVGGGTAGIVGSRTAAALGARVLLVERDRPGGDCLWTGCVPSKALLASARRAAEARRAGPLGVHAEVQVDFATVMRHVHAAIAAIEPVDSAQALRGHGVEVLHGDARFTGPRTIAVGDESIAFRHGLVATGAAADIPDVPGLPEAGPLTSDTVWGLTSLPERLVVLGAGSIGCELAQAFARLGSAVTLVERDSRVLPREDPDASALVHAALEGDGIEILVRYAAASARGEPGGAGELTVEPAAAEPAAAEPAADGLRVLAYDALLVATGRRPRTAALGLELAGVEVDGAGFVAVDDGRRTSNRRIWAAGDVTPRPQLTHVAGVDASVAASNAVLGLRRHVARSAIPRVTFTEPEVASVGAATWADDGEAAPHVTTRHHDEVDRAIAEASQDGFSRLVLGPRGRILGATLVGPRAGESLAEVTLAVTRGLSTTDLSRSIHPYPTYGDGVWNAAINVVEQRLASPVARRVTGAIVRGRAAWAYRRR